CPSPSGLTVDSATNLLRRSNLPQHILARIWEISHVANTANLPFPEFCLCMHLTKLTLNGSELPPSLPDSIRFQIVQSNESVQKVYLSQTPSSPNPRQLSISQTGSTQASYNSGSILQNSSVPSFSGQYVGQMGTQNQHSRGWIIEPSEKARFDAIFKVYDPQYTGDRAKAVFLQSGLQENMLAHIWNLCDTHNIGKLNPDEFAVAMHLVYAKLGGKDLPHTLPPELIPPSTRDFNNMASLMKNQVISDIITKQSQPKPLSPFSSLSSLNDPLLSLNSPIPHSMSVSQSSETDEKRKHLIQDLEFKKRELLDNKAVMNSSKATVDDLSVKIDKLKSEIVVTNGKINHQSSLKSSLLRQSVSIPSNSNPSYFAMQSNDSYNEIKKLSQECLDLENRLWELKITLAKKRDAKRNFGNVSAVISPEPIAANYAYSQLMNTNSTSSDPVASKAAAILAQRMAALGLSPSATPIALPIAQSSVNSGLHAELARIDEEKRRDDAQIFETQRKATEISERIKKMTYQNSSGLTNGFVSKWNPTIDQKMKFEEGIGLKTDEARNLVKDLQAVYVASQKIPDFLATGTSIKQTVPSNEFSSHHLPVAKEVSPVFQPAISFSSKTLSDSPKFIPNNSIQFEDSSRSGLFSNFDSDLLANSYHTQITNEISNSQKNSYHTSYTSSLVNDAIAIADAAIQKVKENSFAASKSPTLVEKNSSTSKTIYPALNQPKSPLEQEDEFSKGLRALRIQEEALGLDKDSFFFHSHGSEPSVISNTTKSDTAMYSSMAKPTVKEPKKEFKIVKKPPPPPPAKRSVKQMPDPLDVEKKLISDFEEISNARTKMEEAKNNNKDLSIFQENFPGETLKTQCSESSGVKTFTDNFNLPATEDLKVVDFPEIAENKSTISVKKFSQTFNPFGQQTVKNSVSSESVQQNPTISTDLFLPTPPAPPIVTGIVIQSTHLKPSAFKPLVAESGSHKHSFSATLEAIKSRKNSSDDVDAKLSQSENNIVTTTPIADSPLILSFGGPPPPPPLPPLNADGTFVPIKIAPSTLASESLAPKRKLTPAEVGAVGTALFPAGYPSLTPSLSSTKVSNKIKSLQGAMGHVFGIPSFDSSQTPADSVYPPPVQETVVPVTQDETDWDIVNNEDAKSGSSSPLKEKDYAFILNPTEAPVTNSVEKHESTLFQVRALFSFDAARDDELSMAPDDIIDVLKDSGGDWLMGRNGTQTGHFPRNYTTTDLNPKQAELETKKPVGYAEVLFDYESTLEDEISIVTGEIVAILDKTETSWWRVERKSKNSGLAPSTYLKELTLKDGEVSWLSEFSRGHTETGVNGVVDFNYNDQYALGSNINTNSENINQSPADSSGYSDVYLTAGISRTRNPSSRSISGIASSTSFSSPLFSAAAQWATLVDPSVLQCLSSEERKRQESIFELVSTESTYVRDLQIIVEVFYQPMSLFMKDRDLENIFANIDEILLANSLILSDLESYLESQGYVVDAIGSEFAKHIPSLDCYATYCRNQMNSSKFLQQRRNTDRELSDFLKECFRNPKCRSLDLSSFLLQPMQRITRYSLLLKQILHYTPKSHPDYSDVIKTIQLAEKSAEKVNLAAKDRDNENKLETIANIIDLDSNECKINLLSKTRILGKREFVMDGPLLKGKSGRKLHGFLFNDVLLFTEPSNKPTGGPTPQSKLAQSRGKEFFLYRKPVSLNEIYVRDISELEFTVVHLTDSGVEESIGLRVIKNSDKKKWCDNISSNSRFYRDIEAINKKEMESSAQVALRNAPEKVIGTLEVKVIEAKKLATGNKIEAFAKVILNEQSKVTSISRESPNPFWNQ
ncbi:Intersectin-2, partial [Nowakowskiella sp. JEL0078]